MHKSISSHFRRAIIAGILAVAPIALTLYIISIIIKLVEKPANGLLHQFNIEIPGLGFLIFFVAVYLLGLLVTNVLGKTLFDWGERILVQLPIVNPIYKTIKQITRAFSGTGTRTFRSVVYVEYPRPNAWTLAFVTGESRNNEQKRYIHLFVPTTPNPTSGFFIMVPEDDIIESGIDVEDGLQAIISGGMLAPTLHKVPSKRLKESN